MNKFIDNVMNQIFVFLDFCLEKSIVEDIVLPGGVELKGIPDFESSTIQRKVKSWSQGTKYLEFKFSDHPGLYIRLNKSHFDFKTETLRVNSPEAFSFYHRKRKPGRKHAKMTLICHLLSKGLGDKIQQHINAIPINNVLEKVTDGTYIASQSTIPTLREFLPIYESIMYLNNPNTVNTRIQLINSKFSAWLDIPVNHIRGAELLEFIKDFKRDRTAIEVQEGASRFTVEESTMKGYLGAIRGVLSRASNYSSHPFDLCETLYSKDFNFIIDNESDRYLTDDKIKKIIKSLAKRDKAKFKHSNNCNFSDYLTPLLLLCLSTGLRPKYAKKLKWSHVDFKNSQVIVKGDKGKIRSDKVSDLTNETELVLKEWKKHVIHTNSKNGWVFPSPQKPKQQKNLKTEAERQAEEERLANHNTRHLTSYKTTFTTFKNEYNLEWFVMYDLRHTFATIYTAAYKNIHETQNALHHVDPKSVKRYARHLPSERKDATAAFANMIPTFAAVLQH